PGSGCPSGPVRGAGGGPAVSPGANPGGFGKEAILCRPDAASPASYSPPLSPTRGSSGADRGLVKTVVLVEEGAVACPAAGTGKTAQNVIRIAAAVRQDRELSSVLI